MPDGQDGWAVLARDTSAEAEDLQVRAWRAMTPTEIARLVDDLSSVARALALSGLPSMPTSSSLEDPCA